MLRAMREQWARFPPLPVLAAHYLGAAKTTPQSQPITNLKDQDVIPSKTLSRAEFDDLLRDLKLPTAAVMPPETTP
jgi:hypothetical protein